jgi:arsenite methyltransferase
MKSVEVFDRPLCCSTGVCGPSVDPALIHFAADLAWLKERGVDVHRYNLAHEPGAFTRHLDVREALQAGQVSSLPLIRIDGAIVSQGTYPSREQLAAWCGVEGGSAPIQVRKSCCSHSSCT